MRIPSAAGRKNRVVKKQKDVSGTEAMVRALRTMGGSSNQAREKKPLLLHLG